MKDQSGLCNELCFFYKLPISVSLDCIDSFNRLLKNAPCSFKGIYSIWYFKKRAQCFSLNSNKCGCNLKKSHFTPLSWKLLNDNVIMITSKDLICIKVDNLCN